MPEDGSRWTLNLSSIVSIVSLLVIFGAIIGFAYSSKTTAEEAKSLAIENKTTHAIQCEKDQIARKETAKVINEINLKLMGLEKDIGYIRKRFDEDREFKREVLKRLPKEGG